jgi:TonB-dependent SusC/RagA subfamily outer membrane receptor
MKKTLLALALFAGCLHTAAFCQTDSTVIKNATTKLKALLTDHIIEKAYLHFDKPYYAAGDTMYFKAYVTIGERHELSRLSGILHVDLIGTTGALMKSLTLQLINGLASGDFSLPDTLQKGNYRVRAYTQWMRNNDAYFFNKYISVGSVNNVANAGANANVASPRIQFFPEGGSLINDVRSRLAFKAIGADGLGVDVKGVVIDNEKTEVLKFASSHLGMGVFEIIPEAGRTYKAKLTFANGAQTMVDLPAAEAKGITLAVNNSDPAKISIEIRANRLYYKENLNKDLNLIIYWGGAMRTVKTKLDNEVLGLDMPKANFPTGIMQVTLLSQTGEPLSERLSFIQNPDQLNLVINTDKPGYKPTEKVHINLNAKTRDNTATKGNFSVSVIDENKVPVDENTERTILSDLLLTSELKGTVEQPNYYFASVTSETRANLDALMLTQGYRRFVWKQLLNENLAAAIFQPEKSLEIAGSVKSKTGTPLGNKKVELIDAETGQGSNLVTDAQGNFRFPAIYMDGAKFLLKTESGSGKNQALITLKNADPQPEINAGDITGVRFNEKADMLAALPGNQRPGAETANNASVKGIVLKNVIVRDNKAYHSSNVGGAGHADQVISGEQIKFASSLTNGLNGLARGIDFIRGVPYLKISNVVSQGAVVSEPMLIIIDGAHSSNVDNVNPINVETVEILKGANAAIYGTEGGAGVMVITTRQGGIASETASTEMSPGIYSITPKGFYKAREFYSPAYNSAAAANQRTDLRTTICWKPELVTDNFGNSTFEFFNAASKGTYRIVVEGIDDKGNLGRQVMRYKVE